MAWSDGSTVNTASSRKNVAAAAMAGAVFRPMGSPTTIAPGHSRRQASIRAWDVITTTCSAGTERVARAPAAGERQQLLRARRRAPRPEALAAPPGEDERAALGTRWGHRT